MNTVEQVDFERSAPSLVADIRRRFPSDQTCSRFDHGHLPGTDYYTYRERLEDSGWMVDGLIATHPNGSQLKIWLGGNVYVIHPPEDEEEDW